MNATQRHMIAYMAEVLAQEDVYFYEAWCTVKDFVLDALSDEEEDEHK